MADFDPVLPSEIPQQQIPSAAVVDTSLGDAVNAVGAFGMEIFKGAVKEQTRRELADEEAQIEEQVRQDEIRLEQAADDRVGELLEAAGPQAAALMEQNPTLMEFQRELAKNQAAVEQGVMDSATADMRMEARARTMLNRFPGLAPQIREVAARHASGGRALSVQAKLARIDQRRQERVTAEELRKEQLNSALKYGFTAADFQQNPLGVMNAARIIAAKERSYKDATQQLALMEADDKMRARNARILLAREADNGVLAESVNAISGITSRINTMSPAEWENFLNSDQAPVLREQISRMRDGRIAAVRAQFVAQGMSTDEIDKLMAPALAPFDRLIAQMDGKAKLEQVQNASALHDLRILNDVRGTKVGTTYERLGKMLDFLPEALQQDFATDFKIRAEFAPLINEALGFAWRDTFVGQPIQDIGDIAERTGQDTGEVFNEVVKNFDMLLAATDSGQVEDKDFASPARNMLSLLMQSPETVSTEDRLKVVARAADPRFMNRFAEMANQNNPLIVETQDALGPHLRQISNDLGDSIQILLSQDLKEIGEERVRTTLSRASGGRNRRRSFRSTPVIDFVSDVAYVPAQGGLVIELDTERMSILDEAEKAIVRDHAERIKRRYNTALRNSSKVLGMIGNGTEEMGAAQMSGFLQQRIGFERDTGTGFLNLGESVFAAGEQRGRGATARRGRNRDN